ncbi:MAG TPA: phage major capsid protein, partial [Syntrophales bacterium]|nr:phage major capsid protein [Syntrophales bacterium]
LAASFIELLRNKMLLRRLGAQVLGGLVGDIAIPKQTGGATAYWVGENANVTESQQTFGQVALSPRTVGTYTDISRKLLIQSSLDVEAFVRNDLATVLALAIDYAGINGLGQGSSQPLGILQTSGIGAVAIGTDGGAPTWSHIVDLETEVSIDNADVGNLAYLTNAKVRGKLKKTFTNATYGEIPVWGKGEEPGFGELNGYRAGVSNQVPSNLTKNAGSNLSAIIFGNFSDYIIGEWGAIDILIDPYTGGAAGTVRVRVLQDVDGACRRAESFAAIKDASTT